MRGPNYRERSPEEIITEKICFDSVGYVYRALSWLDVAKRYNNNVCSLQYAAHDVRQAIEQLLFEELVLSVGTNLDRQEYEKCKGNSTKFHKIIDRLNPDYGKLTEFTQAIMSVDKNLPKIKIVIWDNKLLMQYWGKVSNYLHWAGEPAETVESKDWIEAGIAIVNEAAQYIWEKKKSGHTGIMMPDDMKPEIRDCWE